MSKQTTPGTLPGELVRAQHLRHGHTATEIMLRREGAYHSPTAYVIYLDRREVARVAPRWEVRRGIPGFAHAAYERMDEIAGYSLADDRGFDTEASMSR